MASIISRLRELGFKVGAIKHAPHGFQFFKGKDSSLHKVAGAKVSIVSGPDMIGILKDTGKDMSPFELMGYMEGVDLVLVEGFKRLPLPKIEVFNPSSEGDLPLCLGDPNLKAIVSTRALNVDVPIFDPRDIESITRFVLELTGLERGDSQRSP